MPRDHVRKIDRASWLEENLFLASQEVKLGKEHHEMRKKIYKIYEIPEKTHGI
jgi:hypothetical protein